MQYLKELNAGSGGECLQHAAHISYHGRCKGAARADEPCGSDPQSHRGEHCPPDS